MELGYLPGKMKKLEVKDRDSNKVSEVQAHMAVNAAGLYAQQLAKKMQGLPSDTIPESFLARGHYCTMEGKAARSVTSEQSAGPHFACTSVLCLCAAHECFFV